MENEPMRVYSMHLMSDLQVGRGARVADRHVGGELNQASGQAVRGQGHEDVVHDVGLVLVVADDLQHKHRDDHGLGWRWSMIGRRIKVSSK